MIYFERKKMAKVQEFVQGYKDQWLGEVNYTLTTIRDKLCITQMVRATITPYLWDGLQILCDRGAFELKDPTPELLDSCERHLFARLKLCAISAAEQYFAQSGWSIDWTNLIYEIDDIDEAIFDCDGLCTIVLNDLLFF
jgi:hypothetical protein